MIEKDELLEYAQYVNNYYGTPKVYVQEQLAAGKDVILEIEYFNGVIYIDPSHSNAIDFSQMGVTRMACPNTLQETAMLVALEQTVAATRLSNSTAQLTDRDGKVLIKLKRILLDSTNP